MIIQKQRQKVKALKQMQYGSRIVQQGVIGEVVASSDIYDFYVKFHHVHSFGVFKDEVELIKDLTEDNLPPDCIPELDDIGSK